MAKVFKGYPDISTIVGKRAFLPVAVTGTLDASVTPTSETSGYNLGNVQLAASVTPTLVGVGETSPNYGFTDASVTPTVTAAGDVSLTGTLDLSITPTLTAVGIYGQDGTLSRTLVLTSATYGSPENKGTLDRRFAPNWELQVVASGKIVPISGTLNSLITPTIVAAGGTTSISGTLDLTIPLTSVSAEERLPKMLMAADTPAMTISAVNINTDPNFNTLPALTIEAIMLRGNRYDAAATLPALTIETAIGSETTVTMPALTIDAVLEPGNYSVTNDFLPALTGTAVLDSEKTITAAADLPALTSVATLETSGAINAASDLPALQILATASSGNVADVSATLPVLSSSGFLAEIATTDVAATLPSLYSNAQLHNGAVATFNPYTMNTESYGVSQYSNYNFHTVFQRGGQFYGVNASGIYELAGSDDVGTDIAASFRFGISDLKNSGLKRVPYIYAGYKSDGDMTIDVSIDGEPAVRQYTVGQISHTSGIKRGRAKVARGLKSRYWQFGASNVAGSDFEFDKLGFYVQQFDRKAQ